ncbi:MAG: hypothetical protein M1812_005561 [Candelaria pacifica]|nr:MAG: hypothetical protein M1812_005561 [Candelaria pacifica]
MATSSPSTSSPKKLKILMLHGYTQSGPLFHAKSRALEKTLQKAFPPSSSPSTAAYPDGLELIYPTAPLKLSLTEIPGLDTSDENIESDDLDAWAWWRKNDQTGEYEGMDQGLARIADVLKSEGPFAGVVGFSQGAAVAGMVASLLEKGRKDAFKKQEQNGGIPYPDCFLIDGKVIHSPLSFAISYSGFGAPSERYRAFYEPKIETPVLHFLGSLDSVVEESRSQQLIDACVGKREERVVFHPGGHFLPSQKQFLNAVVGFIREVITSDGGGIGVEEKAEDMNVPF